MCNYHGKKGEMFYTIKLEQLMNDSNNDAMVHAQYVTNVY